MRYPSVTGDKTPASLSRKWITEVLRRKIGYRGLILSDDLEMGGVLAAADIGDAAVETIRAGADIFLVCHNEENVWRAFSTVLAEAERDHRFRQQVEAAAERSRRFKQSSPALNRPATPAPTDAAIDKLRCELWELGEKLRLAAEARGAAVWTETAPGSYPEDRGRPMIVAGVMSGTSADGVNVALVRLEGRGLRTRLQLLAHREYPYPPRIRSAVLAAMNSTRASVADLARLNFRLAEVYADAVQITARESGFACDLIGCHGQTIYHQGDPRPYLGRAISATWQTGEGSVLAARLQVPVVSDFRPADMAAGGKGAPLVPFLDYLLFRHARRGRILQNIGGIGNLTAIPAGAKPEQVIAFDTGPGNMVIDALAKELFGKPFDRDGALAARGVANRQVLRLCCALRSFAAPRPGPPDANLVGLPLGIDWPVQWLVSALIFAALVWAYWKRRDPVLSLALLVTATFLFTPYILNYDMVVFGFVVALMLARADNTAADYWLLFALWTLPVTMMFASIAKLPIAPIVLIAFAARLVWRLAHDDRREAATLPGEAAA